MTQRILLVDDEPNILNGYKRHLRKNFDVELAEGGRNAIEALTKAGPFAVVVSDMQMPDVNGMQVLAHVANNHPDTVRIMLTGNADQKTAVDAANEGRIFRFLNKPCLPETLSQALDAGLQQYQLVRAEHELLTKTLGGSISLMTEVLSLVNPTAFGRAARVRSLTRQICVKLAVPNAWEVEIAAMLSQIGCVSIPSATLEKLYGAQKLTPEEQAMISVHPQIGAGLVRRIPRLQEAAHIIEMQNCRFGAKQASGGPTQEVPLGARILKAVIDYDSLLLVSPVDEAITILSQVRADWYDPQVLQALTEIVGVGYVIKSLKVNELAFGMIFDEPVMTLEGSILVAKGQEVNETLIRRLQNFVRSPQGVKQPIRVRDRTPTTNSETVPTALAAAV